MKPTRRTFNRAVLGGAASAVSRAATPRPNILFIITDDQRWDQMGCAGHPFLRTPHLDRLAAEGARFTNAFVTTSLCSPARASFLTGRYAHAHGVIGNWQDLPAAELRGAFPYLLQQAGYETGYFGKYHMGFASHPRLGFDQWAALPGQGRYFDPDLNINSYLRRMEGHGARVITDLAIEWLRRPRDKPFCMILGYKEAHGPHTPPPHLMDLYADRDVSVPDVKSEDLRGKPAEVGQLQLSIPREPDHNIPGWPRDYKTEWRNYWRCVTAIDEQVGRVLETLDELGLAEDTLLVFAGDNGFFLGELGLFDKRWAYEPSLRIPLLVRYPRRVAAGLVVERMALNIDLCPTLLDYAGAERPARVHGESWRPLLEGGSAAWRRWFLYEYFREPGYVYWPTMQALRTEEWKYIRYPGSGNGDELYSLVDDPEERNNLAVSSTGPDKAAVRTLMKRLGWEMERMLESTAS